MTDVITVKGRRYIRLDRVTFATVEPACEFLLDDGEFIAKVRRGYNMQVCNGGWGFTVKHEGYRVRFDLPNTTCYRFPRVYEGHILEEPKTVQLSLLEVTG